MNKIINIRGTSGSGKSTLVRAVMDCYPECTAIFMPGRKRPLCYKLSAPGKKPLFVIGHYETACGGTDTISTGTTGIFDMVRHHAQEGDVLFEGLLIGVEVSRTAKLPEVGETHVIALTTPIDVCVDSINLRRKARGVETPVDPENTRGKYGQVTRTMVRLQNEAPGVVRYSLSREEALAKVKELLGL
jgi:hypothetical protein